MIAGCDPGIEQVPDATRAKIKLLTDSLLVAVRNSASNAACALRDIEIEHVTLLSAAKVDRRHVPTTQVGYQVKAGHDILLSIQGEVDEQIINDGLYDIKHLGKFCDAVADRLLSIDSGFVLLDRWTVDKWCSVSGVVSQYEFMRDGEQIHSWVAICDPIVTEKSPAFAVPQISSESVAPQTLSPRAANNYVALIAAMAMKHYQYDASDPKSDVPAKLEKLLVGCGVTLTAQTIRGYLQRGAERLGKQK